MSQASAGKRSHFTAKRALVVDDAKSARVALRKQLEKQGLVVDTADSAEEALRYLCQTRPDVIFMDHMMPGMDGFQAVKAIKNDPTTAMIPIMMYTSKEGEVYLGQARALGAVGVLPKQLYHAELDKTLSRLGLTPSAKPVPSQPPFKRQTANPKAHPQQPNTPSPALIPTPSPTPKEKQEESEADTQTESPQPTPAKRPAPRATSKQTESNEAQRQRQLRVWLLRLLVEERQIIKKELQEGANTISRQVVEELTNRQRSVTEHNQRATDGKRHGHELIKGVVLSLLLLAPSLWFYSLYRNNQQQQLEAQQILSQQQQQSDALALAHSQLQEQQQRLEAQQTLNHQLLETMEWSLNQSGLYPYGEIALDDQRLKQLQTLLSRLTSIGFRGTLLLEIHSGDFCLQRGRRGRLSLPAEMAKLSSCSISRESVATTTAQGEHQSKNFNQFIHNSPLLNNSVIQLQIHSVGNSKPLQSYPDPASLQYAGEWNRIAQLNNRIELRLRPHQ